MERSYSSALKEVLRHEGGYVNHPRDPGGATNFGVTQRVYDAYRRRKGVSTAMSVRHITNSEVQEIYRTQYWDQIRGNDLPDGLDYAVFDFGVNSGPSRAIKFLQRILGVQDDGIIGNVTLAAAHSSDAAALCGQLCDNRLAWLKRLRHWDAFGRGWTRRVEDVREKSILMAGRKPMPVTPPSTDHIEPTPPPTGDLSKPSQAKENWTGIAAAVSAVSTALGGVVAQVTDAAPVIQYAVSAVIVMGVGFLLWSSWRSDAD